ncbi:Hypothetical protein PBC10988_5760 [Planctomycetales bacterium 10988]|nr:Hypothetical protein PBC10988_5760 [Planctomycetales bacterium 10988]
MPSETETYTTIFTRVAKHRLFSFFEKWGVNEPYEKSEAPIEPCDSQSTPFESTQNVKVGQVSPQSETPVEEFCLVSNEEIGQVAGEIWSFLHHQGPATFETLDHSLEYSRDTLLLGVGWLCREDKLNIQREEEFNTLSLR